MAADVRSGYVHALRFRALTPFYDLLLRATLREDLFKGRLVAAARLAPGMRVLDVGCGTGTLALMCARACPGAEVVGLDGDPEILAIARRKAAAEGLPVDFELGLAGQFSLPPASFDRVLSSLVLHHIPSAAKPAVMSWIAAVLKPGGELHVADWGRPASLPMAAAFLAVRVFDGFDPTSDNAGGRLPGLMEAAGLAGARETERFSTVFGTLSLFRAERPH